MTATKSKTVRCAIYTRTSSEDGLEQAFNSLDAQREACEAFIKSQAHEGWRPLPARFDDGGHSGGTVDRPGFQRLLEKVRSRQVDVIVIYKIDRLTRSLADFARLAELFDAHGVSFVSVTQQFNTATSMGRLMLNVLLSFAQFEREVTGERIRDKIAASKKKGIWMGGNVPLGYNVVDRSLVINEVEAETVRTIFRLYREHGNVRTVKAEAERLGLRTKIRSHPDGRRSGGVMFRRGHIDHILRNPLYAGRIRHKEQSYPGTHQPIIDRANWEAVQKRLTDNKNGERTRPDVKHPSPLAGLVFDYKGNRFTPSHSVKSGRRYRYYVQQSLVDGAGHSDAVVRRIPAREIEAAVRDGFADFLCDSARLLDTLGEGTGAEDANIALREARLLHAALIETRTAAWPDQIRQILQQVVLEEDGLRLHIVRTNLHRALGLSSGNASRVEKGEYGEQEVFDLHVPARIRMRGVQKKLLIGNDGDRSRREQDTALIKAVARAHGWFESLKNGQTRSVGDIARAEGLTRSYVSRLLRLAFLAPDIVEAVLDGRHPFNLTVERLTLGVEIPLDWREQRRKLGFDPN